MIRLKILIALFLLPLFASAQEKEFSILKDTRQLQQELAQNATKTQTIASDFIQEKSMKMLQDKVISHGKFYFKQPSKIRIEYTTPFSYLLVMSGGNITIKDNGKVNKINAHNSKMMQSVNQVMLDCMRGTVFDNKDFSVEAFAGTNRYLLSLTPLDAAMKKMFSGIRVYIQKSDLTVDRLVMIQNNGDQTAMKFNHTQINTDLSNALFFVR